MTVSSSSQKPARASERKHEYNKPVRSTLKTHVKAAKSTIESKDLDKAEQAIREASSALDRAAQKKVIHRNSAARQKSRLMARLNRAKAAPKK